MDDSQRVATSDRRIKFKLLCSNLRQAYPCMIVSSIQLTGQFNKLEAVIDLSLWSAVHWLWYTGAFVCTPHT